MSRRCCSPPESSPIGRSGVGAWRRPGRSPRRPGAARRPWPGRRRRPGSGRPQRSPSRPRRTTSTPRMRSAGVEAAALGQVADRRCRPRRAAAPSTSARAGRQREQAEERLDQVDFPTPFGPRTATNSPASIDRSTPLQMVRPPTLDGGLLERSDGRRRRRRRCAVIGPVAWRAGPRRAACSWAVCQSWKVAPAGASVSVTVDHRDAWRAGRRRPGAARRAWRSGG